MKRKLDLSLSFETRRAQGASVLLVAASCPPVRAPLGPDGSIVSQKVRGHSVRASKVRGLNPMIIELEDRNSLDYAWMLWICHLLAFERNDSLTGGLRSDALHEADPQDRA